MGCRTAGKSLDLLFAKGWETRQKTNYEHHSLWPRIGDAFSCGPRVPAGLSPPRANKGFEEDSLILCVTWERTGELKFRRRRRLDLSENRGAAETAVHGDMHYEAVLEKRKGVNNEN